MTITLSGPAAAIDPAQPNLNGIDATANGATLIVNHSALGALFTVNPRTGASAAIAVDGLIPGTPDGLLLAGRNLWVVENFANLLVRVTLSPDLASGTITSTISSPLFRVPTTVAKHGDRLALVNGRFDLGLPPPFARAHHPGPSTTSCRCARTRSTAAFVRTVAWFVTNCALRGDERVAAPPASGGPM